MSWYYVENGQRCGPVSEETMLRLIRTGTVEAETLVWHKGMDAWAPLKGVPGGMADALIAAIGSPNVDASPEGDPCSICGKPFPPESLIHYRGTLVCAACKPGFVQNLAESGGVPRMVQYAGFWIRFVAKFIDGIILTIVASLINLGIGAIMTSHHNPRNLQFLIAVQGSAVLLQVAIAATYTTWFLGKHAATPGKMALGLKVVTPDAGKVSYGRALGRHFAEFLSSIILCIGYLMAGFDEEKRSLHDRICHTRVVRK